MVNNNNHNTLFRIENGDRIYPYGTDLRDIFSLEIILHLNNHLNLGYKIYYLECSSKCNFSLTLEELNYLYTLDNRLNEPLYYVFSDNIKSIKQNQKLDLFFLTNLKNLDLLILIPKLNENNQYYFNLIIGVKLNFNLNYLNNLNFISINVVSFIELDIFNLTENYIKQIFNFRNNKFRDNRITDEEFSFCSNELTSKNGSNSKLTPKGRRIYKKIIFKHICFHMYWLGSETQLNDMSFYIDYGFKDKFLIKDSHNNLQLVETYHPSCLLDLISNDYEHLCFDYWQIYNY